MPLWSGGTKLRDQAGPEDPRDPKGAREATGYGGPNRVGATYSDGASYSLENNKFEGTKLTLVRMASLRAAFVDRPVVDMTELQGGYDLGFPVTEEDLHATHS
jgi:uncharacterized protein (TIGR03435 family)